MAFHALVAPFIDGTLSEGNAFVWGLPSTADTVKGGLAGGHWAAYAVGHADNCIFALLPSGRHENLAVDACPFVFHISNQDSDSKVGTAFPLLHADATSDVSDVDTCGAV